jgi:hypothetical protein
MIYLILGIAALCAVLILIVYIQSKIVKKYKNENAAMRVEINNAAARLEHIREYMNKSEKIGEAANAERKELNKTDDGALACRANALFGGVRNGGGGAA